MRNIFKVDNKINVVLVSLLLTFNRVNTYSGISFAKFEQRNASWEYNFSKNHPFVYNKAAFTVNVVQYLLQLCRRAIVLVCECR